MRLGEAREGGVDFALGVWHALSDFHPANDTASQRALAAHTSRGTGLTAYLEIGGHARESASRQTAAHAFNRPMSANQKLYLMPVDTPCK